MKILILNGPNLNMLGIREPEHYGVQTYSELCERIAEHCRGRCEVRIEQSNHEGVLVDLIHGAYFDGTDGIVINPGAYTHTSIALLDALRAVGLPCVEVHISDVNSREEYRKTSYVREACIATVSGKGTEGYLLAVDTLIDHINGEMDK